MCEPEPTPAVPMVAFGLVFDPGDQLGEVLCRQLLRLTTSIGLPGNCAIGSKSLEEIVRQRVDRAVDHMRAPVADAERVAVRCRFRDTADADRAGGAGDVFDDDVLPERAAHMLGHHAAHHVGRAAGGERHHHGDRPRRIIVGGGQRHDRRRRPSDQQPIAIVKLTVVHRLVISRLKSPRNRSAYGDRACGELAAADISGRSRN